MKKLGLYSLIAGLIAWSSPVLSHIPLSKQQIETESLSILNGLSLPEKIGQKLMIDIPYWCSEPLEDSRLCTKSLTQLNPEISNIIRENNIGGVILFSNNLIDVAQITTLTTDLQKNMTESRQLPLLIATDQEGGIVARLPAAFSVTFPGNMALAAAYLGRPKAPYATAIGKMIATNLKAVGINIDFAPDVDVNVNPLNPVIHVRSFSDDEDLVSLLGLKISAAIQSQGVAATLKHFPGHGDVTSDSHIGLPFVSHTLEQALEIDLHPFKYIIQKSPPDLIMTAHIQFPALDDSTIYAGKLGIDMITPATLSRKIQTGLLRKQLGFKGVLITDALDMGAIAENFDATDATIKAFQAGVDIALMPLVVRQPEDAAKVSFLISNIESAVLNGSISKQELDQSVLRIIKLKLKLGLLEPNTQSLSHRIDKAKRVFSDKKQRQLERKVTDDAVTIVQNNEKLLPIKPHPTTRIFILMPWLEQGSGMSKEIVRLQSRHQLPQKLQVNFAKMAGTTIDAVKKMVDKVDIVIVGNSTTKSLSLTYFEKSLFKKTFFPIPGSLAFPSISKGDSKHRYASFDIKNDINYAQLAYQTLNYAKNSGKKTIFISLLAPYDLPNYRDVSDAMLAGYNFYGYYTAGDLSYYRGPSMQALMRIIFGLSEARGKLPINIPNPDKPSEIIYSRGFGFP